MLYRNSLKQSDVDQLREILSSSGYFYDFEVEIAIELAQENLEKGADESGYSFIIAEKDDHPLGFVCFGKIPCTKDSYDLYWIAVHQSQMGKGIGKELMNLTEDAIRELGGKNIWIETSSRPLYEPTRQFYLKTGCDIVAELPDFYANQDNKVIFLKKL